MTADTHTVPRPLRAARRFVTRALLIAVGVVGGLFAYFVCQGMFSGYPQYHTDWLGTAGMILIALTGGVAWIIDHRRIDDGG
jgi:H+/Cl- antiporter ClcA